MPFPEFILPLDPCNVPVRRCPVPRQDAERRILIMRLGSHGDILMATPLLAALRAAHPNGWITWIAEHTQYQVMDANPYIDEMIVWDGDFWKNMLSRRRLLRLRWLKPVSALWKALRARHFDVFISFQPEEWPLLLPATGAGTTIGVFDAFRQFTGATATSPYARRYTHAFTSDDLPRHRTDQYLLPLRALGLPEQHDKRMVMGFTADDARDVDRLLGGQGIGHDDVFAVIAPRTNWESRNWPEERYVDVCDALSNEGTSIVLIGSARPEEQAAVRDIAARTRTPVVTFNALSFRQMAALIGRASVLVSGDTGPMHVAAAVGTPYVALFGPTPVAVLAPLAGKGRVLAHSVPCGPCYRPSCVNEGTDHLRCLRLITVAEVLGAVSQNASVPG